MSLDINKILSIVGDANIKLQINELYSENIKLKEENYNLKKENDELKKNIDLKSKLLHEDNHYFLKDGDKKEGPYCTKCMDVDDKLVRLHQGNFIEGIQYYSCPNCKTQTTTGERIRTPHLVKRSGNGWGF